MTDEKTKLKRLYCKRPDRDVPKIECGYPIPCPHHPPAEIDLARGTITMPGELPERTEDTLVLGYRLAAIRNALADPAPSKKRAR